MILCWQFSAGKNSPLNASQKLDNSCLKNWQEGPLLQKPNVNILAPYFVGF